MNLDGVKKLYIHRRREKIKERKLKNRKGKKKEKKRKEKKGNGFENPD